jgi:hypothetical protein
MEMAILFSLFYVPYWLEIPYCFLFSFKWLFGAMKEASLRLWEFGAFIIFIITTYKPTNLQTYKPTNLQTYKPTNLQTYKPTNTYTSLLAIVFNILLYIAIRAYLSTNFHLVAEDVESSTWSRYYSFIYRTSLWYGKRSYVAIEGFSLLIIFAFFVFMRDKKYKEIVLSFAYWLPILAISFLVGDTVRTLSFTFVFWLIALIVVKERVEKTEMKVLAIIIAFINILIPVIFP